MVEALGNFAYTWKGTSLRVMVASKPKVKFDQMEAPVPDIMDMSSIPTGELHFLYQNIQ
jgi:hypothetical protein